MQFNNPISTSKITRAKEMKKQINPSIKAQILRSAFILLSLVAVSAIPFALAQSRSRGTTKRSAAKPNPAHFSAQSQLPGGGCAQTMYGGNGNGENPGALVTINQTNG